MVRLRIGAGALLALLVVASPLRAEDPAPADASPAAAEIFPLDEVRPGMRGHGLTVRQGVKIDRFEVEVIDVLHNYLAKQDVILVRCLGEDFADHQIVQGMSGSPIYFDGRIAGALAYTWPWSKHPVGGVTPIANMLAEGQRPLEGRPNGAEAPTPLRRPLRPLAGPPGPGELQPIGTPVCTSGFSPEGRRELVSLFRDVGWAACDGGSVGGRLPGGANLEARMEPGAAMVLDMVRGDFTVATIGTCTWVDGDTVYGFGHPFQTLGETALPMSVGYIYMQVASRQLGFKVGAPLQTVGTVIQDRPAGVVGRLGPAPAMVPFRVSFKNRGTERAESFRFQVMANTHVFSRMMVVALREAFKKAEATQGRNTKHFRMTLSLEGMAPVTWADAMAGFDGGFRRSLLHLVDRVLNHQTQRARILGFELDVEIEHVDRRAQIVSARASQDEVRRGDKVEVIVDLDKREGLEPVRERIRVTIPHDAPLGNLAIEVRGGDFVSETVAAAVDLADLARQYEAFYRSTDLMALLPTSRVDVTVAGRVLKDVPHSTLARLARSPEGVGMKIHPVTEKVRRPVPYLVLGSAKAFVRVVE